MAIALDATSGLQANGSSGNLTHTCTGPNLVLVAFIIGDIAGDNLTGVTYNGVAMSFGAKSQFPADRWVYVYTLVNPSTGANSIATTGLTYSQKGAISYTGCLQSSQPDSAASATVASSTTVTATTTVVTAGSWLSSLVYSAGASQVNGTGTIRGTQQSGGGISMFDSNAGVGTGSQSITLTQSAGAYNYAVVSIKPAILLSGSSLMMGI